LVKLEENFDLRGRLGMSVKTWMAPHLGML